jgi:hypothetical protein
VLLDICATDYFFYTCCTHIRIQFKLIKEQFENIISDVASSASVDVDLKEKFNELIKWHQEIIR